jgi:uncharacterized membrane protein
MTKGRLEAFSDGVLAIIITIMVLELKAPSTDSIGSLRHLWPELLSYLLSFGVVGIYWNNHHHMLHAAHKISGSVLWANLHLLFWLSLLPFATAWMGKNHFAALPVALYGVILLMAALSYFLLAQCLRNIHGSESAFTKALGNNTKGKISLVIYTVGIGISIVQPYMGFILYLLVAVYWIIPDRRFETPQ